MVWCGEFEFGTSRGGDNRFRSLSVHGRTSCSEQSFSAATLPSPRQVAATAATAPHNDCAKPTRSVSPFSLLASDSCHRVRVRPALLTDRNGWSTPRLRMEKARSLEKTPPSPTKCSLSFSLASHEPCPSLPTLLLGIYSTTMLRIKRVCSKITKSKL